MSRPRFPPEVRKAIEADLKRLHPLIDARTFIIVLESAAMFAQHEKDNPAKRDLQKDRERALKKVENAARNLCDSITDLDEDAQWYLFSNSGLAHVDDRAKFLHLLSMLQSTASSKLPPADKDHARLDIAKSLNDQFVELGIPFTESNSGFGADCVGYVFNLAGLSGDNVRYWIGKAKA